ncbi:MAG: small multi-drug export protein [Spirochaetales bacterium]|nr:small multi-drug export protein [Spirochaetales bacterium]
MTINTMLVSLFFCLLPIAELRGGIPYAYFNGMDIVSAYFLCVAVNAMVGPLVFIFLSTVHKLFYHITPYRAFFDRVVERARKKVHAKVEKYGYIGIAVFVAIPLPVTGAYTGALGAWVLGMDRSKSFLAIVCGVIVSGLIVSAVLLGGESTFNFLYNLFIKKVS